MPDRKQKPPRQTTLGERIIQAREALDLSTAQLARRMAISTTTLSGWENNRTEPRANRLVLLAAMTSVSLSWLLTGRGPGPTEYSVEVELQQLKAALEQLQSQAQAVSDHVAELVPRIETLTAAIEAREQEAK